MTESVRVDEKSVSGVDDSEGKNFCVRHGTEPSTDPHDQTRSDPLY